MVASDSATQAPGDANDIEKGMAKQDGLWVVGGASTVSPDFGDPPFQTPAKAQLPLAPEVPVRTSMTHRISQQAHLFMKLSKCQTTSPSLTGRVRLSCHDTWAACKDLATVVRQHPTTLLAPLVLFALLSGLGIWGVMAGSASFEQQREEEARSRAVDAATGFQIQLQQTYTPGITFQLMLRHRPEWGYWVDNFNNTARELLTRVPNGSIWNLQLQPFAQVMMMYPFRPEDRGQVEPPRDLLGDPSRKDVVLAAIRTRQPQVAGPMVLGQGFMGALVRYPIFVPDVEPDATFGFKYPQNTSALNFTQLPASVQNCTVCYNATTREKWWGLMTVLINYEAVVHGSDAYLESLRRQGYHYTLARPINATKEMIVAQVGPSSLRDRKAIEVEVAALNSNWVLRVAPADGFAPTWTGPLIAAVVIIALIMSLLLLVVVASLKRTSLLLEETMAANRSLAETTRQLQEEKERMDVLLVRQYNLLQCLDVRSAKKRLGTGDGESSIACRNMMMARIEDARRSLNVAKSNVEDTVQVFEVLGAGAFGKVQRGLWRGTVVAVKTMILPANMTGQQKREKMAVMEAAISSSLVHPNIVTTYTYFIRPYHEPTHEGVQQMPVTTSTVAVGDSPAGTLDDVMEPQSRQDSMVSEPGVHSFEVRLVLEFCDKGSLKDALDQHAFMQEGSVNLAAMLETAADVAKAMVHMHAANVLHSDLKARNIMLKSSGMEGRGVVAKVADFGLSTRMEGQETHLSSCFQGTLTHMAPEVMLEGRISKAADVYSFGILMWELFCGGDPFAGVPRAHMGHAITKENRRPKFPPFAPRDYVALASRCWDPDMALRPTFEEVLAELGRMREELAGDTPPLIITPPSIIMSRTNSRLVRTPSAQRRDSGTAPIVLELTEPSMTSPSPVWQGEDSPVAPGDLGQGRPRSGPSGMRDNLGMNPVQLYTAGIVVGSSEIDTSMAAPCSGPSGEGGGGGGSGSMAAVLQPVRPAAPQSQPARSRISHMVLNPQQKAKLGLMPVSRSISGVGLKLMLPSLHEEDPEAGSR